MHYLIECLRVQIVFLKALHQHFWFWMNRKCIIWFMKIWVESPNSVLNFYPESVEKLSENIKNLTEFCYYFIFHSCKKKWMDWWKCPSKSRAASNFLKHKLHITFIHLGSAMPYNFPSCFRLSEFRVEFVNTALFL